MTLVFSALLATFGSVPRTALDPLTLLQDKSTQVTRLRPYAPPPNMETATLALG